MKYKTTSEIDPYDPRPENHLAMAAKLAMPIAKKRSEIVEDSEAFSDACLGLMNASRNYDLKHGVKFITYAYHSIIHEILRGAQKRTRRPKIGNETVGIVSIGDHVIEEKIDKSKIDEDIIDVLDIEIRKLPLQQMQVIELKRKGLLLAEIGEQLGFSKQRAEQILKLAYQTLRVQFSRRGIEEF